MQNIFCISLSLEIYSYALVSCMHLLYKAFIDIYL